MDEKDRKIKELEERLKPIETEWLKEKKRMDWGEKHPCLVWLYILSLFSFVVFLLPKIPKIISFIISFFR